MRKNHMSLLVATALLSTAAVAAAQQDFPAAAISDHELLAAASLSASLPDQTRAIDGLGLVETAWQTGVGSPNRSATTAAAKSGETGESPEVAEAPGAPEGPETPEGPDADGPGGPNHEHEGEESGGH